MNNNAKPTGQKFLNEARYKQGRYAILITMIMSVINIFSIIFTETYFLYSTYTSQLFMAVAYEFFKESGDTIYIVTGAILAVITIIPFLLCFIFSKKKTGWMTAALVLFSIDSLLLLFSFSLSMLVDIIIHALILVVLASALRAGLKAKKEENQSDNLQVSSDGTVHTVEDIDNSLIDESQSFNEGFTWNEYSDVQRTLTIHRKKSFYGCAIEVNICLNGKPVGTVKNKQSTTLTIDGNSYKLTIVSPTGGGSNEVEIPAGNESKEYDISPKVGMVYGLSMNITERK